MKNVIFILFALFISSNLLGQGIEFEHGSLSETLSKAKNENKLVFIDCYTTWCGPCKMLSKNVFTQKEVGDVFNKQFINLKLDCEKGEGLEIAKKYAIAAYPTMLFLDGDGNVKHTLVGGVRAADLIENAAIALDPSKQIGELHKRYDSGDREALFIVSYIKALRSANEAGKLQEVAKAFIENTPQKEFMTAAAFDVLGYSGALEFNSELFKYLVSNKDTLVASEAIGQDKYQGIINQTVDMYLRQYQIPGTLEELKTDVEVVKLYLDSATGSNVESQLVSAFYLSKKDFNKWFDLNVKLADDTYQLNEELGERMLAQSMISIAMDPQFAQADLYQKAIDKMESFVKESKALNNYFCLSALYKANGNKEKALENINVFILENEEAGGSIDQRISAFKAEIENM
ncbi:thioredoxin family protein [Marinifilum sp. RC60d5]|uniref:thioredoxin family protein n=1 Tax=Marinifilum sp. RC60d5 TaxID=3458414 RepID=UPI0040375309